MTLLSQLSPPRLSLFQLSLILALGLSACAKRDEASLPATSINLADQVGAAVIESSIDLDCDDFQLPGTTMRVEAGIPWLPRESTYRHEGAWVRALTQSDDPSAPTHLLLHRIAPKAPQMLIDLSSPNPFDGNEQVFVAAVVDHPSTIHFDDPEYVRSLLLRTDRTTLRRELEGGREHHRGVIALRPQTTCVVVGIIAPKNRTPGCILRAGDLSPIGWWLHQASVPGAPNYRRRVYHDGITRESIVVGTQSTIRFRVTLPSIAPRFETTTLVNGYLAVVKLTAQIRGTTTIETSWNTSSAQGWIEPTTVDLAPLAGQTVELTLKAELGRVDQRAPNALVAFGAPSIRGMPSTPPLDVVLISLDTVRADRMSLYGYPMPTTPHLDELAQSSIVFDTAITAAPWTLPSHVTMLSGQYPDHHGVVRGRSLIAAETRLLAEDFRDLGYETAAITGGGNVHPSFGFSRGFDRYGTFDPSFPPLEWVMQQPRERDDLATRAKLGQRELEFGLRRLREKPAYPLFLFLHTYVAHEYLAGASALRAIGLDEDLVARLNRGYSHVNAVNQYAKAASDEERQRLVDDVSHVYAATVWHADAIVGQVVEALRASGRLDQTLLIVTSDHGEEIFERGALGHGATLFEELVRIPLLIRVPGLAPRRVTDVVSLVDIAPTIRDLLDIATPISHSPNDGRSLRALLDGGALASRPAISRGSLREAEFHSLRGAQLKLLDRAVDGTRQPTMLFSLNEDPQEQTNLAESRPDDATKLLNRLHEQVASLRSLQPTSGEAALSAETIAQLKELGYLGGK